MFMWGQEGAGANRATTVSVFIAETVSADVSWRQQIEPAGICGLFPISAECASAERWRTGGVDLTGGA